MKLFGLRVLDLTRFLPGPYVTRMMADHGAEVIKIETHEGEPTRYVDRTKEGLSSYFRNTNKGKKSLVLDLKAAEGKEIFLKLATTADVIIESFRPGVVDRLGIGYEAIRVKNPRIVYCSISAFGQAGTMSQHPTHDLGIQAMFGALSLGSGAHGHVEIPGIPAADTAVAMTALVGILMALLRRNSTGKGDQIDAAMADSLFSWTPHVSMWPLDRGKAPAFLEDRLYGGAAFYRVYRTKDDKHVVLSGAEPKFAKNLLTALGRPDLIPLCSGGWGATQAPVIEFLTESFRNKTRDEWFEWLADKDVCAAPVLDLKEAYQHPYIAEREMVVEATDGLSYIATPLRFMQEPADSSTSAPLLGQHSQSLVKEIGYSDGEIEILRSRGVI